MSLKGEWGYVPATQLQLNLKCIPKDGSPCDAIGKDAQPLGFIKKKASLLALPHFSVLPPSLKLLCNFAINLVWWKIMIWDEKTWVWLLAIWK